MNKIISQAVPNHYFKLTALIQRLRAQGKLIIFVSHKDSCDFPRSHGKQACSCDPELKIQ